jgi:uncharacterized protein YdeI (YjbR/CyaY-like superfamily)
MVTARPRRRGDEDAPAKTVYFGTRSAWRRWLRAHYRTAREIWLVYYKKGANKPRIAYNDAVEEALCFGWIDSNLKSLDAERFAQRFTPRKPGSAYSQANKERLKGLLAARMVSKAVLLDLPDLDSGHFEIAADILSAIRANKAAWHNFQGFSTSYKRIRIAFIEGARRRPQEFKKRLAYFIRMTEQNRQFGFGGIEKYY